MDLESLNKTQIILLTLLVSFVTSIATGIATVSLMEKAPTDVTRIISRIIEKPIETITSDGKTVVEERTVVVSEGERIAGAVKKAQSSLVRLYMVSGKDSREFKGMGIIISEAGLVVSDSRIVNKRAKYVGVLSDGSSWDAEPSETQGEQGFFTLQTEAAPYPFTPATFVPFDALVLGQTVVAMTGETSSRISPGVIAELTPSSDPASASRLRATIDASDVALGAPLIDLSGGIVGMPENIQSQIFLSLQETSNR
jgi:S1-C subfamily serine protease